MYCLFMKRKPDQNRELFFYSFLDKQDLNWKENNAENLSSD